MFSNMLLWQHIYCSITKKYWLSNAAAYSRAPGSNSERNSVLVEGLCSPPPRISKKRYYWTLRRSSYGPCLVFKSPVRISDGIYLTLLNIKGNEIPNHVLHDAVYRFQQAVHYFQNVIRFHGTRVSVIPCTPTRTVRSSMRRFSWNSYIFSSSMCRRLIQNCTEIGQ
jgi:hypothetical protein